MRTACCQSIWSEAARRARRAVVFVLACTIGSVSAQEPEGRASAGNKVSLDVTPSICVAPRGMRVCSSDMDIDWLSSLSGDYCLHSRTMPPEQSESVEQDSRKLECWNNQDSGHHSEYVILSSDLEYSIQDPTDRKRLISAKVKIAMLKPHRKYPRRRSRLPWSVIKP